MPAESNCAIVKYAPCTKCNTHKQTCTHCVCLAFHSVNNVLQTHASRNIVFSYSQVKCVCYWPEKLHDSLTVENKFRVTFSSNMPFAEYEFRKFKLENVGSFSNLTLLPHSFFIPLSLSLSLSLPHTHTHTHTHIPSLSLLSVAIL